MTFQTQNLVSIKRFNDHIYYYTQHMKLSILTTQNYTPLLCILFDSNHQSFSFRSVL